MKENKTEDKANARAEVAQVSWADWRNLLTMEEEDQIARETGLTDSSGNISETLTAQKVSNFNALIEFRRSMKLFNQYANGER
jgi:hypothetical protein